MYLQHRTITGLLLPLLGANDVLHKYHPGAENAASSSFRSDVVGQDVDVQSLEEVYNLTQPQVRTLLAFLGSPCFCHVNTSSCTLWRPAPHSLAWPCQPFLV